jgi:hypothetical protein
MSLKFHDINIVNPVAIEWGRVDSFDGARTAMPQPLTIRVSTNSPEFPWLRQTPGRLGVWSGHRFVFDRPLEECDAWFVVEGLTAEQFAACPATKVFLITGEPPTLRRYRPGFLAQFSGIVTSHAAIRHPGVMLSQQALPWHIGLHRAGGRGGPDEPPDLTVNYDYDAMSAMNEIPKTRDLSVICSAKNSSSWHRDRLKFVESLSRHFGDRLDVFGSGFRHVSDKWDAIAPYRYHITLENSIVPHYWTEKLADAYLGGALPLYSGCRNLAEYFPPESFVMIDQRRPDHAIRQIERAMADDLYRRCRQAIVDARRLVLNRYNLFAVMSELVAPSGKADKRIVRLKPETAFSRPGRAARTWARAASWVRSRLLGR